jgi:Sulfatase
MTMKPNRRTSLALLTSAAIAPFLKLAAFAQSVGVKPPVDAVNTPQRSVLPIPDRKPIGLTTYDAKDPDTKFPPISPLRPPVGAPNVLIILLDDVGFGASSAFGGPCQTPTAERLAQHGLKYCRFHTTALCSPTRAAMLSGRNHHAVGMGGITEIATSAPGYNSMRPNTCAPLAEILKLNGYSTAQFGKCHEVPVFESSPVGPFNHWPTGSGFEHFYGFIGGENNQYFPALYIDTTPIEPERTPEEGYHLTEDLADKAIEYIRQQKAMAPDKPFFVYFAPGATHAPHHVPKPWIEKYKGKFDQGWDKLREETFARQKALSVIPPDCGLTKRPDEIPAWEKTEERLRPVLSREMEIYAAFLEHVKRSRRRNADDPAPACGDHALHKRPRGQVRPDRIDHHRLDPCLGISLPDQLNRTENAGGIDQNRGNPEAAFHLRLQGRDRSSRGDVGGY